MKPIIIAGPCVIESEEIMHETAQYICSLNRRYDIDIIFKASFDKANRTSDSSYRGPGLNKGLIILDGIKHRYGLKIITDIHESFQARPVSEVADIIQIPALLCRQTDLIAAAAQNKKTINIKKGQFLSGEDMRFVIDKARHNGAENIWATERGNCFGYNNNIVDFRNIPAMKKYADAVIMDCTHSVQTPNSGNGISGGNPEYIESMALAAKAFGADGYFFEVHPDPVRALSDSHCSLRMDLLTPVIEKIQ